MDEFLPSYENVWNIRYEEKRREKIPIKEKNKIFRFVLISIIIVSGIRYQVSSL